MAHANGPRSKLTSEDIPQGSNVTTLLAFGVQYARGGSVTPETMKVVRRQVDYYNAALRCLGLLTESSEPTPALRALGALDPPEQLSRLAIAFDQSSLGRAWCEWAGVRSIVSLSESSATQFLEDGTTLSAGLREHRASTLRSWLRELAAHHPGSVRAAPNGTTRRPPESVPPTAIFDRRQSAEIIQRLAIGTALVRAATAYFTVAGYEILAKRLERAEMRLLVGSPEARSTIEEILREYRRSIEQGEPTPAKREALLRLHRELVRGTARVRHLEPRHRSELHAKVFAFDTRATYVGSANLTGSGLRMNIEAGQVVTDEPSVTTFVTQFDEWFASAQDLLAQVLRPIEESWAMAPPVSPWLLYLRVLLELYGEVPDVPVKDYRLAEYQRMIVGSVLAVLREHRGAMLIAPTGTGKTVVAAYIAAALFPEQVQRVIVVPPNKSIAAEWERVLWSFGVSPTIVRHGFMQGKSRDDATREERLGELLGGVRSTDLVIVDECHTFRNDETKGFETLARFLGPALSGPRRLLLTATPMSTGLSDLNAQLQLVSSAAGLAHVSEVESCPFLVNITLPFILQRFGRATPGSRSRPLVFGSREMHFPHVTVRTLKYEPTLASVFEAIEQVDFRVVRSQAPSSQTLLPGIDVAPADAPTVQGFLRVLLLRLAESSPAALRSCLQRLPDRMAKWVFKPADPVQLRQGLAHVGTLLDEAGPDAKLDAFVGLVGELPPRTKVLVFTSFKETVSYLVQALGQRLPDRRVEGLTGAMGSHRKELLRRFAPVAHHKTAHARKNDIDILICTDAISEGENLQDASVVINYDLHWTPLRLIQRVGRVDRPAKAERTVYVWNTYPGPDLFENLVGLWSRLEGRSEFYRDMANTVVLGEHDRDLGEIDAASVGTVRAIYDEQDYASILGTYLPTTRHIVELSSATPEEIEAAQALPLGARTARGGSRQGLYALVRTRTGKVSAFQSSDSLRVAPKDVAPEALLPHIECRREESSLKLPEGLDESLSALLREVAERCGEEVEEQALICAASVE